MNTSSGRLSSMLQERIPIDIGTTSLTAFRTLSLPSFLSGGVAHPIYGTVPVSAQEVCRAGSDFQRVGFIWPHQLDGGNEAVDQYGVSWIETDGNMAPFSHPLEHARWEELSSHPRPKLPSLIQLQDQYTNTPTILDPPCYGLLDTCFMLRNGWQFMLDITENYQVASALLDWALETVIQAYDLALDALPQDPDIIVYGDDLGFESGMYLSDLDFRTFLFPRLKTLFSRIRKRSGAQLCFHSCGAISSIIDDISELGVDMLNLDFYARNVLLPDVRRKIPRDMILHAPVNAAAIGRAVMSDNRASLALLTADLATAFPCIGGPNDNISSPEEAVDALRGVAFIRALSTDDLHRVRELGPVKSIIQKAADAARNEVIYLPEPDEISFGELLISDRKGLSAMVRSPRQMAQN